MKYLILALSLSTFIAAAAFAQGGTLDTNASAPSEVGTTRIAPGVYTLTDVASGKASQLTVTDQGKMILQVVPALATPASSAVPVSGAAAATPAGGLQNMVQQGLQQGMQRGMGELMKRGVSAPIDKMIK